MKTRSTNVSYAVLVALGAAVSSPAFAHHPASPNARDHSESRDVYARVVDVDPIVRRVRVSTPQRECWNEERPVSSGASASEIRSTMVGGLIGAAAGFHISERHQVPRPAAIVGGTMIGAAIGNSIGVQKAERRGEYRTVGYESVQRCQVNYRDEWAEEIDGYRVTYLFHGREYVTRMPYDPGKSIRVNVDVRPEFRDRY